MRSDESVAADPGESARTVQRYIRLTYLIPELLTLADKRKLPMDPAVDLSHLTEQEQRDVPETMDTEEVTPTLKQSRKLKEMHDAERWDEDDVLDILRKRSDPPAKISLPMDDIQQFFPGLTPKTGGEGDHVDTQRAVCSAGGAAASS